MERVELPFGYKKIQKLGLGPDYIPSLSVVSGLEDHPWVWWPTDSGACKSHWRPPCPSNYSSKKWWWFHISDPCPSRSIFPGGNNHEEGQDQVASFYSSKATVALEFKLHLSHHVLPPPVSTPSKCSNNHSIGAERRAIPWIQVISAWYFHGSPTELLSSCYKHTSVGYSFLLMYRTFHNGVFRC